MATEDDAARLLEGDAPAKQFLTGAMCHLEVANHILALLLAALAMEAIINCGADLVWEVLKRLQEMGLAGS